MGGHNRQFKDARQLSDNFLTKTATATLTRREVLSDVTILGEKATAMTLTLPATDTELAGVKGDIGNAGAGVLTVSYTAQSGVRTATLNQGDSVRFLYDDDGKVYLDTVNTGTTVVITDTGDAGALGVEGSVSLVTAGAETRTLAIPAKLGAMVSLTADTLVGDCVVTVAAAINATGNNTLTFDTAGDNIVLIGVSVAGALVWRLVVNNAVVLSTV